MLWVAGRATPVRNGAFEAEVRRSTDSRKIEVRAESARKVRGHLTVDLPWFSGPSVPSFRGSTFTGDVVSSDSLRGSWYVLEWIDPRCMITRDSYDIRSAQVVQNRWRKKGVRWYLVSSTPAGKKGYFDDATWNRFRARHDIEVSGLILDQFGELERAFSVKETRTAVVVDPSGHVVYSGAFDNHDARREIDGSKMPPTPSGIDELPWKDRPNPKEPATSFVDLALTQATARRRVVFPRDVVNPTSDWG